VLATQVGDRDPGLVLLQDPDDLLFREAAAPHVLVLSMGQNELQTGLSQRGNVTAALDRTHAPCERSTLVASRAVGRCRSPHERAKWPSGTKPMA